MKQHKIQLCIDAWLYKLKLKCPIIVMLVNNADKVDLL